MTYRIAGLSPESFAPLFALSDAELAARNAERVTAAADRGFPCRISLEDARTGDELILLNHTSHDVETPFRTSYAIFVRNGMKAAEYVDRAPELFASRTLGLRGFNAAGMLCDARLAPPGAADAEIRTLLDNPEVAYIDAHNAAAGCFLARVERHEGEPA